MSLYVQTCALVLRRVYNFSAEPGRCLEHCNTHDSLAPWRCWLEISKKVKHNLVPQAASKLQDVKVWSKNFKIWHLVTLVPLEVQGCALPFRKPPIHIFKEPDCHGCCSALNVSQAILKNCICVSRLMHRTVARSWTSLSSGRVRYYSCVFSCILGVQVCSSKTIWGTGTQIHFLI